MKQIIATDNAPAAIGPYSQATIANGMMYISGQLPIDPQTGSIESEDIKEQAAQSLKNVIAIAQAGGVSVGDIIKVNIFITDMGQFSAINDVYKTFFTQDFPARAVVEVSALPLGANIEIEAVAAL